MFRYEADQMSLARARYNKATEGVAGAPEFSLWLGFAFPTAPYLGESDYPAMNIGSGNPHPQVELCLSPHWFALIRASFAKEGK